ncbi:protein of unknown function DUF421 [Gottschalkia purinilytica]|uniref:YetF C-terminal domain-containing protein n=1 Tax=Gottschalkia purinilytica TaxID=1503 RepID=A0A0L0W7H5_GOTPU|nr:YetF domain-containing protein [Gottschalkia purinilytica]KNF07493.1 protein of unknown function DUF421 [Gottschalkia purinilytica]
MHNHLVQDPIYIIRAFGAYFIAMIIVRIMGKRSIGELGPFDFVLMASIGDILAFIVLEKKVPFHDGVLVLITLGILEVGLSKLTLKSRKMAKIIEGGPTYLIRDGKVIEENLNKENISKDDITKELRKHGISNICEVKEGIIESCGKFTVILKEEEEPIKRKDIEIFGEGESSKYLDRRFSQMGKEIDRLNESINNLIIEIRNIKNKE